ncbi:MAG: Lrp/AsnC family transcriptional regulator [Candidatus Bathyarchaeia archaeon]
MSDLDDLDKNILRWLQKKGKVYGAKMARDLGVPESTVYDRIKKLKCHGYIRNYIALIDPEKVGMGTVAFFKIFVDLNKVNAVANELSTFEEVSEVYAVAGDFKILIKVRAKSLEDLDKFIEEKISDLEGVTNYYPIITLRKYKDDPRVQIL